VKRLLKAFIGKFFSPMLVKVDESTAETPPASVKPVRLRLTRKVINPGSTLNRAFFPLCLMSPSGSNPGGHKLALESLASEVGTAPPPLLENRTEKTDPYYSSAENF